MDVPEEAIQDPFGLVGKTLDGQYRVDQAVGEGGFGVVYKGWHLSLEQPVAIKALKVFAEDPNVQEALLARFKEEAKLLYTLSQASLHIVRAIDFGGVMTVSGAWSPYMVLEWLEGRTIAEDLDDRRRRGLRGRTIEEAMALLGPAAEGLSVAHQRRIAHRDVKPANFFVVNGPGAPNVKVLDFGIAKILRDGETGGTKSPFASFTYLYAAPEQLDPRIGATGLATDVYAFALVLTELLTGRSAIEGRDVVSIMREVTDPVVRPTPRARGANVPDAVEAVCRRALAVDPAARYPSIHELWSALRDAIARSKLPAESTLAPRTATAQIPTPPPASMPAAQRPSYGLPAAPASAAQRPSYGLPAAPPSTQGYHAPSQPRIPYAPPPTPMPPAPPVMPPGAIGQLPPQMPAPRYWPQPVRRILPQSNSSAWIAAVIALGIVGVLFTGCGVLFNACLAGN